ncbi:Gfo/Idh/MocA family protein [Pseudomonas eucalypticola]|uniref:Gfo/Idh/MocA family oxidoreductase n=1 Tax=Pseudomonas eucalypticola TaxID=2599595 RepID=A0A7D5H4H8_9PSED|nr:Gfo/Idh/MocA family oxidoreductase [Pseudomonas eucalypticola]QKZ05362.1 Gfo/Idh/MocA family oxidoreductase [Pseudomonas eucalypticola]
MPLLRIAVAGAGMIGRSHLEQIHASPDCQLAAIVDPSAAARELADRYQVPLYPSLEALFAAERPDGIILATPNPLHVPQALACLAAEVPALVEKPLAHSLEDGERLYAASLASNTPLLVGHHRAHSPILEQARRLVGEGVLGNLVAVMGSALFFKPDEYFAAGPWRTVAGGGPILLNLIHEIGNLRSLCGEIVEVQAMASSNTRGFEVEDTAAVLLRFASGALGTFMLSDTAASPRSWEQTSEENKSYCHYDDEDCYVITGTFGQLSVPTMRLKRFGQAEDRSWWKPFDCEQLAQDRDDPLARQLAHFCQVIRGQAQPLVSVRDGLQNLRVVEAIAQACQTRERVVIPQ